MRKSLMTYPRDLKNISVDGDTKKFCLMLHKGVYPNEYTEG